MADSKASSGLQLLQLEEKVLPTRNGSVSKTKQTKLFPTNDFEYLKNMSVDSFDDLPFGTVNFKISYYHITKRFDTIRHDPTVNR
jgi:hypothetical protein